jgi:putative ABC transport system substrate-binding protein
MMKIKAWTIGFLSLGLVLWLGSTVMERNKKIDNTENVFKVSICKVIEHEAINSVAAGIKDYLMNNGNAKVDFAEYTCQGNQTIAAQVAAKAACDGTKVFVTIGTVPTQAAFKLAKSGNLMLVFSSVTNPNDISSSFEKSNTTGVSNFVPLEPQIRLFRKIQPNLKRLGVIYNSGEANSKSIVDKLRSILKEFNIKLVEFSIQKSSDLPQAANAIIDDVDAVFISNDNTVLSGILFVVNVCAKKGIPVYVSDTDQVEKGCLAALGPNQFEIGRQAGKMIEKIKNGEDVNNIKIEYPIKSELFINQKVARTLGIQIPSGVLKTADKVFKDGDV